MELGSDHRKLTGPNLLLSPKCNDFSDSFAYRRPPRLGQRLEMYSEVHMTKAYLLIIACCLWRTEKISDTVNIEYVECFHEFHGDII